MTFTNVKISFGKFYNLFEQYWNCCLNRENRELYKVFVERNLIYCALLNEWKKFGWCKTELRWICNNLDYNVVLVDPELFLTNKKAYVKHLKNCCYLNSESYGD